MSNFAKMLICLIIGGCVIYFWKSSKESESRVVKQELNVTPDVNSEKVQDKQKRTESTKKDGTKDGYVETALGVRIERAEDISESLSDEQEDSSSGDENVTALGATKTPSGDIEDTETLEQEEDVDNEQGDWMDDEKEHNRNIKRNVHSYQTDDDSDFKSKSNKKKDEKSIADKQKRIARMRKTIENNKRKIEILNFRIELHEKCRHCDSDVCKRRSRGTCLHSVSGTIYGKNYKATHRLPSYGSDQTGIDNAISALSKRVEGCQRNIDLLEETIEKVQQELGDEDSAEYVEDSDFSPEDEMY